MSRQAGPRRSGAVSVVCGLVAIVLLAAGCAGKDSEEVVDRQLEAMLIEATSMDPAEENAVELVEAVVAHINDAEAGAPLVAAGQRSQVARALAPFLADINIVFQPEQPGNLPAQRGAWSPDGQPESVIAHQVNLRALLTDLGSDPHVTEFLLAAQGDHVMEALAHYLSDQERTAEDRLADAQLAAAAYVDVTSALLTGALGEHATVANAEAAFVGLQRQRVAIDTMVADESPRSEAGSERLEDLFQEHASVPLADLDQAGRDLIFLRIKYAGRANAEMAIPKALYASVEPDDPHYDEFPLALPPLLREAREEKRAWGTEEREAWDTYLGETPTLGLIAQDAGRYYVEHFPDEWMYVS